MDNVLEMAALGRPFSLGMLYDCRSDMIVPGVTLWDRSELDSIKTVQDQSFTKCSVIAGNEEGDKFDSLGISADMKLSVMSGQVKVSGAAKYLNTKNYTKKLSTVTLHYEAVRKFEQMNMEQLGVGQMKHLDILDSCTATHVVTGIQYGADVFLEFSTSMENNDSNQNIQGKLKIAIENISSFSGGGAINVDERQSSLTNQLKCSFDGDVAMRSPPTTFSEAVEVYKQLPDLVGQGKQKRIWLHPLVKLDSRAHKLVRHISDEVVGRVANYMCFLNECQARANDLKLEDACQKFYRLQSQLATFCDQIKDCDSKFKYEILPILPRVRGGSAEECELLDVLRKFQESQFSESRLTVWLDNKEREIIVLNSYSKLLKDIPFATRPGKLDTFVSSFDYEYVYALTFSLGDISDFYLEAQTIFLRNSSKPDYQQEICNKPWLENVDIKNQMMVATRHFKQAAEYARDERIKFIVSEKQQQQPEGVILMLYNDSLGKPFDIPGRPSKPSCTKSTDTTVSLEWKVSDFGKENILGFEIYVLAFHQDPPAWQLAKQIQGSEASTIISNLTPNTKYKFKITPLCIIKQGLESQASETIKTEPKTSPQQESEKRELAKTQSPAHLGIGKSELMTAYSPQQLACENTELVKSNPPQQQRLANKLAQKSILLKSRKNGCPAHYQLITEEIFRDSVKNIKKVIIGTRAPDSSTDQILMLMGATGAGKTTLLNAFANYYYGVTWKDNFRFVVVKENELSQTKSQTKTITAYSFEPMEGAVVPYRTVIVDTPGFGDTAGLEEDKKTVEKIRHFFSKPGDEGISHLNGVGFVVQAPLARLTPSQRFVFDQVLAIFGKNMAQSIFLMVTFADGQVPPVLEAVKEVGITYQEEYRLNNSALFAKNSFGNEDETMDFAEMFWKLGQCAMKNFFVKFRKAKLVSLAMTIEVLNLRNQITTALQGLRSQITVALGCLGKIKKDEVVMELHKAEIEGGKEFEYTVEEIRPFEKSIAGTGEFVTHCRGCNFTCHYPCKVSDDDKLHCHTMYRDVDSIAKDLKKVLGKTVDPKNLFLNARKSACKCNPTTNGEHVRQYHDRSCWSDDPNRAMVEAIIAMKDGKYDEKHTRCGSCPGKCHYSEHRNVEYVIEFKKVSVKHTNEDLLRKYKQGTQKFNSVKEMLENARNELKEVQKGLTDLIYQVKENLMKLDKIAQRRNPSTCVDYIEQLIQSEKSEMKAGWDDRIEYLEEAKKQAKLIDKIKNDEQITWDDYEED